MIQVLESAIGTFIGFGVMIIVMYWHENKEKKK